MPVLQPLPVAIDGTSTADIACSQPIMCIKEDEVNVRYNNWLAWIKREQQKKGRKPNQ